MRLQNGDQVAGGIPDAHLGPLCRTSDHSDTARGLLTLFSQSAVLGSRPVASAACETTCLKPAASVIQVRSVQAQFAIVQPELVAGRVIGASAQAAMHGGPV